MPQIDDHTLKQQFDRDGVVALRGFFQGDELAAIQSHVARFIGERVPQMPPEHVFFENKSQFDSLKQMQLMHTYDPFFEKLFLGGQLQRLAELLLDDQVVGKNLQYFNKAPGVGQPTPPHQDGYYFWLEPCEALTMWLALDVVDEENGCVRYVRGSHQRGMRPHTSSGVLGFSQGMTDFGTDADLASEVTMPAQPGDLLVHHALTIHRAGGNQSADRTRRSLAFVYFAERARENREGKDAYQQRLKAELLAAGKI